MVNEWNPTLPNNVDLFDLIIENLKYPEVTAAMKPYPGAIETIQELQEDHEIIFITNRADWYIDRKMAENTYRIKNATIGWLAERFGEFHDFDVYFSADVGGKHKVDADILIDDYHKNVQHFILYTEFHEKYNWIRRQAILLSRKWNEPFQKSYKCKMLTSMTHYQLLDKNIQHLHIKKDWKEIGEYFANL